MSPTEERRWIAQAIDDLRADCELSDYSRHRGPIPLDRIIAESSLQLIELPRLSRAIVHDHLLARGSIPGELGDDEDLAGFLYLAGPFGRIFVNHDDPVPRRRFTAAHELGHFLLHRDLMKGSVSFGDSPAMVVEVEDDALAAMERQANRFAAELLMPAEICRARAEAFRNAYRACPRTPFAYHLAGELLVSPEAMRYRLKDLGVADE